MDEFVKVKIFSVEWGQEMMNFLNEMRQNGILCDLLIRMAEGHTTRAHCCVLASASPFIRSLIVSNHGEMDSKLDLSSFPMKIIRQVINFVYTGRLEMELGELKKLHSVVVTLGLKTLTSLVAQEMDLRRSHLHSGRSASKPGLKQVAHFLGGFSSSCEDGGPMDLGFDPFEDLDNEGAEDRSNDVLSTVVKSECPSPVTIKKNQGDASELASSPESTAMNIVGSLHLAANEALGIPEHHTEKTLNNADDEPEIPVRDDSEKSITSFAKNEKTDGNQEADIPQLSSNMQEQERRKGNTCLRKRSDFAAQEELQQGDSKRQSDSKKRIEENADLGPNPSPQRSGKEEEPQLNKRRGRPPKSSKVDRKKKNIENTEPRRPSTRQNPTTQKTELAKIESLTSTDDKETVTEGSKAVTEYPSSITRSGKKEAPQLNKRRGRPPKSSKVDRKNENIENTEPRRPSTRQNPTTQKAELAKIEPLTSTDDKETVTEASREILEDPSSITLDVRDLLSDEPTDQNTDVENAAMEDGEDGDTAEEQLSSAAQQVDLQQTVTQPSVPQPLEVLYRKGNDYVKETVVPIIKDFVDVNEGNAESYILPNKTKCNKRKGTEFRILPGRRRLFGMPHLVKAPKNEGPTFLCEFCHEFFSDKDFFERHRQRHRETYDEQPERRFHCRFCPYKSRYKCLIKDHERIHTGEKPFKCDECGKEFRAKASLKRHKLTHSKGKILCPHCPKMFCTTQNRRKHIRCVHTDSRPFMCAVCKCCFKSSQALKTHMNTHSDKRKYVCDRCPKSYFAAGHLRTHIRSAHENKGKRFACARCGNVYKTKKSVTKHCCLIDADILEEGDKASSEKSTNQVAGERTRPYVVCKVPRSRSQDPETEDEMEASDGETSSDSGSDLLDLTDSE